MTDSTRMDVHEALDEVKAQKEKLEEELRTKTDLCNNLKKAQNELIAKFQEAKLQTEKQALELNAKSDELSTLTQLHEDLKSKSQEKESSVKHLNSSIEKLRCEFGEKVQKLEKENKDLILALDESNAASESLKLKVNSSNMEIEDLKRIILLKDKKLLEVSDKAQTTKDLTQRDEVINELEEKHREVQEQLKWKNEQFQHLEEAHKKLQDTFRLSKEEWEKERSLLLEEIGSLQTNLDSQIRISENLQTQLRICNQALAHEESSRKLLEVEVSEYKSRLENISLEFDEAKVIIEKLTHKRDEEVAELRDVLAEKDSVFKEAEYKMSHLEQENRDLKVSLKEFQESQIANSGTTGLLKKLQKKHQTLEQVHKKCIENLKEKEKEWKLQMERARKEIDDQYLSKMKVQSEEIKQLHENLESFNFLSAIHNEEMCLLLLVLKSEYSVAYSEVFTAVSELESFKNKSEKTILALTEQLKIKNNSEVFAAVSELESCKNKSEKTILALTEQLEIKNNALNEVNANLAKKCEEVASLMKKVKSVEDTKQHQLIMHEELQRYKNMLSESSKIQISLEEQIRLLEVSQNQNEKDCSEALQKKFVELEKEKLLAENHNTQLELNLKESKTESEILLCSLNEQNEKVVNLQQQLVLLETLIEAEKQYKETYLEMIEEKESEIANLQIVFDQEKNNILMEIEEKNLKMKELVEEKESEILNLEIVFDQEKNNLLMEIEEKNLKIEELVEEVKVLEKEMINGLKSYEEKQTEIDFMQRTLRELDTEVCNLREKLKIENESLLQSFQQAEEFQVLLLIKKSESEKMKEEFENEKTRLESLMKKLEDQNKTLREDITKLLSDREDLLNEMELASKQIGGIANDVELMGVLENMLRKSEVEEGDVKLPNRPLQKGKDKTVDVRLPLVDLNLNK